MAARRDRHLLGGAFDAQCVFVLMRPEHACFILARMNLLRWTALAR